MNALVEETRFRAIDQRLYGERNRWSKKLVEDAETAIMEEQENMRHAENAGLKSRKPETTYGEMFNAVGEVQSDNAGSDDG